MKTKSKNKNFIFFIKFLFQINLISCINSNKENKNIPEIYEENKNISEIYEENKNIPKIDKENKNTPENEGFFKTQKKDEKEIIVNCESGSFYIEGIKKLKIVMEQGLFVFALTKGGPLKLRNRDFFYEFYTTDRSLKNFYIYINPEIKFFFVILYLYTKYTHQDPIIIYSLRDKNKINFEKFTIVNIHLEEREELIRYLIDISVDSIKILESFPSLLLEGINQNRQSSTIPFDYYLNYLHTCLKNVCEHTRYIKFLMKEIEQKIRKEEEEEEGYDFKLYYINQLKNLEENFDTINNLNKYIEKKI